MTKTDLQTTTARAQHYRFLRPPDRKTSLLLHSNKALRSSQQKHEVLHRRRRLGELPTSNPTISRGRAGLSNDPRHQKVSPSKRSSNRQSPGRRHFRPLGPHRFRCSLLQHCFSNSRGTAILGIIKRPRAGTSRNGLNSGPTQRSSPRLGRDVQTYRTCTSIQQALKKKIIGAFEPMYFEILNDNMVGYANISARDILDHLFETYGNITSVDLEINFEHMRRAWDPQQPVESLFKQIQDCADYSEAGGVPIGPSQQINIGYAKIFATGQFMSPCRLWNEKPAAEKTWTHFKSHFAAAHRQHKQMKGETAAHAG
jgi:hypothetical protein